MKESADSDGWTGWAYDADGRAVTVIGDRLGHSDVADRWLPNIRSWLALGAPLEQLSPLSIARLLAFVGLLTWVVGIVVGYPMVSVIVLTTMSAAACAWLLQLDVVSVRESYLVLAIHLALTLVAIASAPGASRVLVVSGVVAVMAVFAGLFLRMRRLFRATSIAVVSTLLVARFTHDAVSFGDAISLTIFGSLLVAMTAFTARTSRLAGTVDPETGILNNRGMINMLRRRVMHSDVVVATVHLTGVTEIRDALGHEVSTELIKRAVDDLAEALPANARVGRGVDDDVVVLVPNEVLDGADAPISLDAHVAATLRRIKVALGNGRYLAGNIEVSLNAHIGIALAHTHDAVIESDTAADVIRRSALAARSARDGGRLVSYWDGQTAALRSEDLELLAELRHAAERGELWLAYQPQVRPSDSRIESVEALLRWTSESHGNVSPGRFIPLAERTGLIERLTDWVLVEALEAQLRWRALGIDISVSVNISPLSLRSVDFADNVSRELDDRNLPASALMLEVTESMAFDIPDAVERLAPLHARGVRISIDDFGTGYTSLSVLPRLPLDELKVDQQFVRSCLTSKASEAIVISICELAHRLGLTAVAEGVEDAEIAALMSRFGFDLLQGYHFDRPMAEAELLERLGRADQTATQTPTETVTETSVAGTAVAGTSVSVNA